MTRQGKPILTGATERAGMQGLLDGGSAGEVAARLHTSIASLGQALARTRTRHDMPLRIVAVLALSVGELKVPAPPRAVRALTNDQEAAVRTWATTPTSDLGDIGRRAHLPAAELKSLLRHAQQHLGFGLTTGWEAELRLLGAAVALGLIDPAEAAQSHAAGTASDTPQSDMPGRAPTAVTADRSKAGALLQAMGLAERNAHATACRIPAAHLKVELREVRRTNAERLREIVDVHGWPTPGLVGAQAAADAVRILLACDDPGFQIHCRNLMKLALDSGELPEILYAYVADTCDVALSIPQTYGTQVNPRTLRPRSRTGKPPHACEPTSDWSRSPSKRPPTSAAQPQSKRTGASRDGAGLRPPVRGETVRAMSPRTEPACPCPEDE